MMFKFGGVGGRCLDRRESFLEPTRASEGSFFLLRGGLVAVEGTLLGFARADLTMDWLVMSEVALRGLGERPPGPGPGFAKLLLVEEIRSWVFIEITWSIDGLL